MSCITKLLEIKGKKEFIANGNIAIEGGGIYKEHEYLITFVSNGYRCGYVAIGEENKIYHCDKDSAINTMAIPDEISRVVHGGVTFFEYGTHVMEKFITGFQCTDKWIGFDAGHYNDLIDYPCLKKYFNTEKTKFEWEMKLGNIIGFFIGKEESKEESIKDYNFMENECKKVIDKVIELGNKNEN